MHIEHLRKRLDGLRQQRESIVAQVNALAGAIQMTESLIQDFEQLEAQVAAAVSAPSEGDKPVSSVVD